MKLTTEFKHEYTVTYVNGQTDRIGTELGMDSLRFSLKEATIFVTVIHGRKDGHLTLKEACILSNNILKIEEEE